MRQVLMAVLGGWLLATPALAQTAMPGMDHGMMESMDRMERDMKAAPMTGNPDHDFVSMMIPHHQGAIDMAEYELRHGRDPALRRLARSIIAAQRREIKTMQSWLADHPG